MEGDFVVVKVMSVKSRFVHYIARVDAVNDDEKENEGVFLRRECSLWQDTPIFVVDEKDEASFSQQDVVLKLPATQQVGGTTRRAEKLSFSCDFSRWNFFTSFY